MGLLGLRLRLLLPGKCKTAWGTRLYESARRGLWDQILCCSVILDALGWICSDDISGRKTVCWIRASERTGDGRSGPETWWTLGWLTCG
jgi:hypothetical protein